MGPNRAAACLVPSLVAAIVGVWLGASDVQPGRACDIAGLAPETLDFWADEASIVAVGTFETPEREAVTLRVEEYLKGDETAPTLRVNNFQLDVCYEGLNGEGHHHRAGERVLAFLEPDSYDIDADWQSVAGDALILEIHGDELSAYHNLTREMISYDEARTAIRLARNEPPMPTPTTPHRGGCGWSGGYTTALVEASSRTADLVVRGRFGQRAGDTISLNVSEYLRGAGPDQLIVNNRHLVPDAQTCFAGLAQGHAYREGQEVLAFLVPDEFNVGADWRPAGQGQAILEVVDGDLLDQMTPLREGTPLLSEVRAQLGPGSPPDATQGASAQQVERDDGGHGSIWLAVGLGAALAAALVVFGAAHRRRRRV